MQGLCRPTHYTGQSAQDWETGLLFQPAPTPSGPGESPRQFDLFHPSSRFRLTPFVLRYALRAPSAYPSRAIRYAAISRASCAATRRAWYRSRSLCGIRVPEVSISCTNLAERCKSRMASCSFHGFLEALTLFSHIVEQEQRALFRSCFLPTEHIGDSKELALRARRRVAPIAWSQRSLQQMPRERRRADCPSWQGWPLSHLRPLSDP